MGLELPGLTASEPAYAHCLDWLLCEALADLHRADGRAHYLRLSTRPVDQGPLSAAQDRMGTERLRDDVLKGAYVLRTPGFSEGAALTMLASGPVSPRCWRRPSNSRRKGWRLPSSTSPASTVNARAPGAVAHQCWSKSPRCDGGRRRLPCHGSGRLGPRSNCGARRRGPIR